MEKPLMLITGSGKGIGKSCFNYFKDSYNVVGVSKTESETVTEVGDVTDEKFRDYLVEKYTPSVFINNAGLSANHHRTKIIKTNAEAAVDLLISFYSKMEEGNIINLSSSVVGSSDAKMLGLIVYKSTKKMLTSVSNDLTNRRRKPVLVTSLEPMVVNTEMANWGENNRLLDLYSNYDKKSFAPMHPDYIAKTIEWIINQPPWVCVRSLSITNSGTSNLF